MAADSENSLPPTPPPPVGRPASRFTIKQIVAAAVAIVVLAVVVGAVTNKKKGCVDANPQALAVQRGWERAIDKAFDLKDWR